MHLLGNDRAGPAIEPIPANGRTLAPDLAHPKLDHPGALEAPGIYIFREAFARLKKLALLWSLGQDSNIMIWLARRAFFGRVPFPALHVDTEFSGDVDVSRFLTPQRQSAGTRRPLSTKPNPGIAYFPQRHRRRRTPPIRPQVRIVIVGHADHGKSLLMKSGVLFSGRSGRQDPAAPPAIVCAIRACERPSQGPGFGAKRDLERRRLRRSLFLA